MFLKKGESGPIQLVLGGPDPVALPDADAQIIASHSSMTTAIIGSNTAARTYTLNSTLAKRGDQILVVSLGSMDHAAIVTRAGHDGFELPAASGAQFVLWIYGDSWEVAWASTGTGSVAPVESVDLRSHLSAGQIPTGGFPWIMYSADVELVDDPSWLVVVSLLIDGGSVSSDTVITLETTLENGVDPDVVLDSRDLIFVPEGAGSYYPITYQFVATRPPSLPNGPVLFRLSATANAGGVTADYLAGSSIHAEAFYPEEV